MCIYIYTFSTITVVVILDIFIVLTQFSPRYYDRSCNENNFISTTSTVLERFVTNELPCIEFNIY